MSIYRIITKLYYIYHKIITTNSYIHSCLFIYLICYHIFYKIINKVESIRNFMNSIDCVTCKIHSYRHFPQK